jgi:hypothetical protein
LIIFNKRIDMKKIIAGMLCAVFVVGVVVAMPTSGKKEEPKSEAPVTLPQETGPR